MTGNLGRNQAQAQQPILRGEKITTTTTTTKINYSEWCRPRMITHVQSQAHLKAVFQLGIKLLMQISRLRFKQSRISMLISHIYVLGRCVSCLVIFRYIWR